MSALPQEFYRDAERIAADVEEGDVMPQTVRRVRWAVCFGCAHQRSSLGVFGEPQWPCGRSAMPSSVGRCAAREGA